MLRYQMTRRFVTCRYEPTSDILIVAGRDAVFARSRVVGDMRYSLELVLPPGITRYRRMD